MGTIVPALRKELLQQAPTVLPSSVMVLDGFVTTSFPDNFLMVGREDPDDEAIEISAEVQRDWPGLGGFPDMQEGVLGCVFQAWAGNDSAAAAYGVVEGYLATMQTLLRTNTAISAALPGGFARIGNERWSEGLTSGGTVVRCAFQIAFKAIA